MVRSIITLCSISVLVSALASPAAAQVSFGFGIGYGSGRGAYGFYGSTYGYPRYGFRYGYPYGYRYGYPYGYRYGYPYGGYPGSDWYLDLDWPRWNDFSRSRPGSSSYATRVDDFRFRDPPPVPTAEQLAGMQWNHLRRVLRFSTNHLSEDLQRYDTGAGWIKHLQLGTLHDQVATDENTPPTEKESEVLLQILGRFQATTEYEDYANVTGRWGFRAVIAALAEYLKPEPERQWRLLLASAGQLDSSLSALSTGEGWKKYLAIVPESASAEEQMETHSVLDVDQLRKTLARYESVSQNPKFATIARIPAFQETQQNLSLYLAMVFASDQQSTSPESSEELPPPVPPKPAP